MSSERFFCESTGSSPSQAFKRAVNKAFYDHGHNGYTGTIAEKEEEGYIIFKLPKGRDPQDYASELIDQNGSKIRTKYDPAGCIKIDKGKYLFFGHAQS